MKISEYKKQIEEERSKATKEFYEKNEANVIDLKKLNLLEQENKLIKEETDY